MKHLKSSAIIAVFLSQPLMASTEISNCGFQIIQPGHYRLSADLDCSNLGNPIGIVVNSTQDVEIDLAGYSMKGKPNQTYGGSGNGILVYNSQDVKIDGTNHRSVMRNWRHAIRITNSSDVKVDGDLMSFTQNSTAIYAGQSDELEVKQVRMSANYQRDVHMDQSNDIKVERSSFDGQGLQGLVFTGSYDIEVRHVTYGRFQAINFPVIFYNSYNGLVYHSDFDRAQAAVTLSGNQTQDIELKSNDFGDRVANTCDVRVVLGADDPELQNNGNMTSC